MYVAEFLGSSRPRYAGKSEIDWWTRPVSAGRLRDADVDADAEVACQVDSAELWLNSTNELRRWSVRKRAPVPWARWGREGGETEWAVRERPRKGGRKGRSLLLALLSFRRTFRQRCDDELITDARARRALGQFVQIRKLRSPRNRGRPRVPRAAISDYRMSVSYQRKKKDPIIYSLPSRMRDVAAAAAEAALHFVSSYDGFREINRKVGWKFRSSGIDLALRLHTGLLRERNKSYAASKCYRSLCVLSRDKFFIACGKYQYIIYNAFFLF